MLLQASLALLLLLPASTVFAFDWHDLGAQCSSANIPGLADFVSDASDWELFQLHTQTKIDVLTNQTCPEYLQSANGAMGLQGTQKMTLEQYIAEHTGTFHDAGETTGRAHKGDAYLATNFNRLEAIASNVGWSFAGTHCGTSITGGRDHYAAIVKKIERISHDAGKKCSVKADAIAAEGPQSRRVDAGTGAGSASTPTGNPAQGSSTITGEIEPKLYNASQSAVTRINSVKSSDPMLREPASSVTSPIASQEAPITPESALSTRLTIPAAGGRELPSPPTDSSAAALNPGSRSGISEGGNDPAGNTGYVATTFGFGRLGPAAMPSSAPGSLARDVVPLQNDDKTRFLSEFSTMQGEGAPTQKTLFDQVSRRYRQLSNTLR